MKVLSELLIRRFENRNQLQNELVSDNSYKLKTIKEQIDKYLGLLGKCNDDEMVHLYEEKIGELNIEKRKIEAQKNSVETKNLSKIIKALSQFMEHPDLYWRNADIGGKHRLFYILFGTPLEYTREAGYRTPESLSVIKLKCRNFSMNNAMVTPRGIEPLLPG